NRGDALRYVQVIFEKINVIADPWQRRAVSGKCNSCNLVRRHSRHVMAGNPLRRGERERPGRYRKIDLSMKQFARCIAQIGKDLNGWFLREHGIYAQSNEAGHKACGHCAKESWHFDEFSCFSS